MFETIINQYKSIPNWQIGIEIIVFIFGILSVYFAKKENILVYPTGIIATVLSIYIMYNAKYFADMSINIYYSVMSIYGWFMWKKNKNQEEKVEEIGTYDNKKENYLIEKEEGKLNLKKTNDNITLNLDFTITKVPQIIKSITYTLK